MVQVHVVLQAPVLPSHVATPAGSGQLKRLVPDRSCRQQYEVGPVYRPNGRAGTGPVSRLLPRSRLVSLAILAIDPGIDPVSRFPYSDSHVSRPSRAIAVGIAPVSWLPARDKPANPAMAVISVGMPPPSAHSRTGR